MIQSRIWGVLAFKKALQESVEAKGVGEAAAFAALLPEGLVGL